jgi:mono/diheme cytochrome c family protein
MNDVRKLIYGTIFFFLLVVSLWVGSVFVFSCGLNFACLQAAPVVNRTPIPTLIPVKLPAAARSFPPAATPTPLELPTLAPEGETPIPGAPLDIARPSNPGGPGPAVDLTGSIDNGKQIFADNCQICHGEEGKGGYPNPGTADGTVPALNPIDPTLVSSDYKTFAINLDLFIEHGSVPEGSEPVRSMPAWGARGALTPQQIADVIAYIISLNK